MITWLLCGQTRKKKELLEFLKTVPALYDSGLRVYSKRTDREYAFREIAKRLGTTGQCFRLLMGSVFFN